MYLNIMMNGAMYPKGWHAVLAYQDKTSTNRAKYFTRTQKPPKYYLIDFGISYQFASDNTQPRIMPIISGDRTAPELQGRGEAIRHDPFPTDIYYLGNVFKQNFLEVRS